MGTPEALLTRNTWQNYRSGAFDESIEICNDMISKNEDDSAELLTNTVAAYVSTGKSDKVVKSRLFNPEACPDSYEFAYNYSCALLGRKKYKAAATLLKKAIGECRRAPPLHSVHPHITLTLCPTCVACRMTATCRKIMAEDGAKQSEVDNELAILKTQLAYTCIMAGRRAQAEELCQEVVKSRPSDATVMAVAANNLAVLRAGRDLFDSVKRNKTALAQPVVSKLTPAQRRVMSLNRAILLCYMNRVRMRPTPRAFPAGPVVAHTSRRECRLPTPKLQLRSSGLSMDPWRRLQPSLRPFEHARARPLMRVPPSRYVVAWCHAHACRRRDNSIVAGCGSRRLSRRILPPVHCPAPCWHSLPLTKGAWPMPSPP